MPERPTVRANRATERRSTTGWHHHLALLSALAIVLLGACSRNVTVEQVDRQVELDADGRVLGTSASSSTLVEGDTPTAPTASGSPTSNQADTPLTTKMATDGPAAIDCGAGATDVKLTGGAATTKAGDGSPMQIELVGTARLDDFDGDGRSELAATYRCVGDAGPVALSLSLWHASQPDPRRTAVSATPIEAGWTVKAPTATDDGQVSVIVLADGQQVRQVLAAIEGGRLRLVSDGPPPVAAGVDSPPLAEFPDQLVLDASGLGPLRIGSTEAQLTDALALVVSEVLQPPIPPCFGRLNRALQVGPIYLGLTDAGLQAIWVTGSDLVTTDRTIALAAAHSPTGAEGDTTASVTVGDLIDAADPPAGLAVGGFGDGWVVFGPDTGGGAASIATESETTAPGPQPVTGFGIAERACLTTDFMPAIG